MGAKAQKHHPFKHNHIGRGKQSAGHTDCASHADNCRPLRSQEGKKASKTNNEYTGVAGKLTAPRLHGSVNISQVIVKTES
jgi:hypothetical protein